jgi:hypothetical protein
MKQSRVWRSPNEIMVWMPYGSMCCVYLRKLIGPVTSMTALLLSGLIANSQTTHPTTMPHTSDRLLTFHQRFRMNFVFGVGGSSEAHWRSSRTVWYFNFSSAWGVVRLRELTTIRGTLQVFITIEEKIDKLLECELTCKLKYLQYLPQWYFWPPYINLEINPDRQGESPGTKRLKYHGHIKYDNYFRRNVDYLFLHSSPSHVSTSIGHRQVFHTLLKLLHYTEY